MGVFNNSFIEIWQFFATSKREIYNSSAELTGVNRLLWLISTTQYTTSIMWISYVFHQGENSKLGWSQEATIYIKQTQTCSADNIERDTDTTYTSVETLRKCLFFGKIFVKLNKITGKLEINNYSFFLIDPF